MILLTAVLCSAFGTMRAAEPSKFQVELGYRYTARLHSRFADYGFPGYGDDGGGMWALRFLYNLNPELTVGAGVGYSGENTVNFDASNAPIYGLVEWHPFSAARSLYFMGELGYGLGHVKAETMDYEVYDIDENGEWIEGSQQHVQLTTHSGMNHGYYGALGLGWKWQPRRHFGMNFQMGYMLRQYRHVTYDGYFYDLIFDDQTGVFRNNTATTRITTGSLFLSVGITI